MFEAQQGGGTFVESCTITFKWLPPANCDPDIIDAYVVTVISISGGVGGNGSNGTASPDFGVVTEVGLEAREFQVTLENVTLTEGSIDVCISVAAKINNTTGPAITICGPALVCLASGTLVTMADGKTKPIESILYSDKLKVWDFDNGTESVAQPLWIKKVEITDRYNLLRFSNGTILKTIGNHRCFNKSAGKFTSFMTNETPVGTTTITDDGKETTLVSQEVVEETVEYYNIITTNHFNIYANGILTSCRLNNLYPIQDMRFQKSDRTLRDRSEFHNIDDRLIDGLRLCEQPLPLEELIPYCERLQQTGRHWNYLFRWEKYLQPNLSTADMRGIVLRHNDRGWVFVARSGSNSIRSMVPSPHHHYYLQDVGLPNFPICCMVRNPIERFRSSCAYMERTPEEALSMSEEFHFWSLEKMGLIRPGIKYFKFPEQYKEAVEWFGLSGDIPIVNNLSEEIKPILTPEQEEAVKIAYAADIKLWNSL